MSRSAPGSPPPSPTYATPWELPNYDGFSPAIVVGDLRGRIATARASYDRYIDARERLSARLAALTRACASAIRLLEARHAELSAARDGWAAAAAATPTAAGLEAALLALRARAVARMASAAPLLDAAPFIAMGVLRAGETLAMLPARVDAMLARRARGAGAPEHRDIAALAGLYQFESDCTRAEVERLRSEVSQTRSDAAEEEEGG
jgi:hypothetical protein